MMNIESSSPQYWTIELELLPWGGDVAVMDYREHGHLSNFVYDCFGAHPLFVKYGGEGGHVPVFSEPSVPADTIAIPSDDGFDRRTVDVKIAKKDFAHHLMEQY